MSKYVKICQTAPETNLTNPTNLTNLSSDASDAVLWGGLQQDVVPQLGLGWGTWKMT